MTCPNDNRQNFLPGAMRFGIADHHDVLNVLFYCKSCK